MALESCLGFSYHASFPSDSGKMDNSVCLHVGCLWLSIITTVLVRVFIAQQKP